jgi:hypothetical protein
MKCAVNAQHRFTVGNSVMTKKTVERLGWASAKQELLVRAIINGEIPPCEFDAVRTWIHACYNRPAYASLKLCALNEVMEGYGVEGIYKVNDERIATYVNMGETYTATVVYRDDTQRHWDIISMGDLVELYERKGIRIK